jgi:hypothetical protein
MRRALVQRNPDPGVPLSTSSMTTTPSPIYREAECLEGAATWREVRAPGAPVDIPGVNEAVKRFHARIVERLEAAGALEYPEAKSRFRYPWLHPR